MLLAFLQSMLETYTLSYKGTFPVFSRKGQDLHFCILPKFLFFAKEEKNQNPHRIYILPFSKISSVFLKQKHLEAFQPLYFASRKKDGSFILFDQRYFRSDNGLYKIPPLETDLSVFFEKNPILKEKEDLFFFPKRETLFYFKGDSTDCLSIPSYEKALLKRKAQVIKKNLCSLYLFLKTKLDA